MFNLFPKLAASWYKHRKVPEHLVASVTRLRPRTKISHIKRLQVSNHKTLHMKGNDIFALRNALNGQHRTASNDPGAPQDPHPNTTRPYGSSTSPSLNERATASRRQKRTLTAPCQSCLPSSRQLACPWTAVVP